MEDGHCVSYLTNLHFVIQFSPVLEEELDKFGQLLF